MKMKFFLPALLLVSGLAIVLAESDSKPKHVCETKNGTSCEECLKNVTCLWCIKTKSCITYPVNTILPPHSLCPLDDARWGLCWRFPAPATRQAGGLLRRQKNFFFRGLRQTVCRLLYATAASLLDSVNFQTLIITLSVLGAVLIIAIMVCMFCCCKCENLGSSRFEAKMQRQANKTKTKQEERRAEMKQRHQEIRQKYGLSGPNPYSKFS